MLIAQTISNITNGGTEGTSTYVVDQEKFQDDINTAILEINEMVSQVNTSETVLFPVFSSDPVFQGITTFNQFRYNSAINISGTNIDNLTTSGFYYGSNVTFSVHNLEVVGSCFITVQQALGVVHQFGTIIDSNRVFTRTKVSSGWSPWVELVKHSVEVGGRIAIFGYGYAPSITSTTNLVSSAGVVSADITGVGTARIHLAASSYGVDKGIFGYGYNSTSLSMTNLVSNTGTVSNDVTGVGTARYGPSAASYGVDKGIFGFGNNGPLAAVLNISNLISNTGVVATDVANSTSTPRQGSTCTTYGTDKAVFLCGVNGAGSAVGSVNLVSNTGIIAADSGDILGRGYPAAASYGIDKAIIGFGYTGTSTEVSEVNLISNTGVIATNTTSIGTARYGIVAASYSTDKVVFAYGANAVGKLNISNLVSNTGVVAADITIASVAKSHGAGTHL